MYQPAEPTIAALNRYPVKGFSAEPLNSVEVTAGETIPFDRTYAVENGPGRFDPAAPRYLPKINFLMLMRDQRLAALETRFEEATQTLTISRDGKRVVGGQLNTPVGRQLLEQFLAAYMKGSLRGAPRIVTAPGHSFSDVPAKCLHIVNLETVRDLSRSLGRPVDPLRFRANLYIEGLPAWSEFDWVQRTLTIGEAEVQVFARTERCDATDVNPATAERDMSIPSALRRLKGHCHLGVYAKVTTGGRISVGDAVIPQQST